MTPLSLSGPIGSISERAEGRDPREGPKLGMATGMPVCKKQNKTKQRIYVMV